MDQPNAESFFTLRSFSQVGSAAFIVYVVSNTWRVLAKTDSPIPAFLCSLIVSFAGAYLQGQWRGVLEVTLIVLNGCLLFLTALGLHTTGIGIKEAPPAGAPREYGKQPVRWFSPWFRGTGHAD